MRIAVPLIALFILAFLGGGAFLGYHFLRAAVSWERVDQRIAEHFPDLPLIDGSALDAWLADEQRQPPLLLDARSAEEYALSRLPNAVHVGPGTGPQAAQRAPQPGPGQSIVVYSATGPRAAPVARDLRAAGHDARLLRHGIFAWANAGLPLVNDQGPTEGVHQVDNTRKILLNRDLRQR